MTRMAGVQSCRTNAIPCGGVHRTGDATREYMIWTNWRMDGWMQADILATETNTLMRTDFRIPLDSPADWVETLLDVKSDKEG